MATYLCLFKEIRRELHGVPSNDRDVLVLSGVDQPLGLDLVMNVVGHLNSDFHT